MFLHNFWLTVTFWERVSVLNQTESPIFVILCVLCFQRQSFFTFFIFIYLLIFYLLLLLFFYFFFAGSGLSLFYVCFRYVSLSDNEKTGFKARELKSVQVDAVGVFLKLNVHKNHINKYNLYNQVWSRFLCRIREMIYFEIFLFLLWLLDAFAI